MKFLTGLLFVLTAFSMASCATNRVGPDYEAGRLYAYEIAKKDAWDFDCYWFPSKVFAAQQARKYTEMLESQGRNQTFIDGFYYGYEWYYYDQLNVKCGR